jgi:hypothetical protein
VRQQAALVFEGQDPPYRRVDAGLGEFAVGDGREHRVHGHVEVRRHEQHVDAGLERQDGHPRVAVLLPDALHRQRVGDDHTPVAEFAAQEIGEDRPGECGRVARRIERGDHDVCGHDGVDPGGDRGPERRRVDAVPLRAGV